MATYITLAKFTDQGIRTVKDTTKRAEAVKVMAQKFGVEAKDFFWTMGKYDLVVTWHAPDDAAMLEVELTIASAGNVRTQTLRAFTKDDMNAILSKLGN